MRDHNDGDFQSSYFPRLYATLLRCGSFHSDGAMRAVLADPRVSCWQYEVPHAESPSERVRKVTGYLRDKVDPGGTNALILLLHVLSELCSPEDACRRDLIRLADEFSQLSPLPDTVEWDRSLRRYRERVETLYGTMRVLGKHTPISLEGIYTDVYLLDKPATSLNKVSGRPEQIGKRLDGLDVIRNLKTQKLIILGKPGTGKTTFLKYMALRTANGELGDRVPIYVPLRVWDDDKSLLDICAESFIGCGIENPRSFVDDLLQSGFALLLLDGLDEIGERSRRDLIKMMEKFGDRYLDCQILITCRTATTSYQFQRAARVEVADFNEDQMRSFITNWFVDDAPKVVQFRERLRQDKRLRDLSRTPLLLGLLCLTFDEDSKFPQNRVDLYELALDALLKRWDDSRNIERDGGDKAEAYHNLSLDRKRLMFARIAYDTFTRGDLFFTLERLDSLIADYLTSVQDTLARIDIDAESMIRAIENQHGLLVQRARREYSFSHLTFQEYYTAYFVVAAFSQGDVAPLRDSLAHIYEDSWREVIFIIASMMSEPLRFFHYALDMLEETIRDDEFAIALLTWAAQKAENSQFDAIPVALRSAYCFVQFYFKHTDHYLNP